jgi:hypothetical protein
VGGTKHSNNDSGKSIQKDIQTFFSSIQNGRGYRNTTEIFFLKR